MTPYDDEELHEQLTDINLITAARADEVLRVFDEHLAEHGAMDDGDRKDSDIDREQLADLLTDTEEKLTDTNRTAAFRVSFAEERIRAARDHLREEADA